jgi:hypothetical protein
MRRGINKLFFSSNLKTHAKVLKSQTKVLFKLEYGLSKAADPELLGFFDKYYSDIIPS